MAEKSVDVWPTPFGQGVLRAASLWGDHRAAVRKVAGESQRFRSLLLASVNKYLFLGSTDAFLKLIWFNPKDYEDRRSLINDDGWILTVGGQRTGRRAINFYSDPVDRLFEPHPRSGIFGDGDAITLNAMDLAEDPPQVIEFVAVAAHEMQHALNYYASANAQQNSKPDFATRIAAFLKDEAGARMTERVVRKEIKDPGANRTLADARTIPAQIAFIQAGVEPPDIARSFPSGLYTRTYAETFVIRRLQRQLVKTHSKSVNLQLVWKDVNALLDRPFGSTSPIADPDATPPTGSPAITQLAEPLQSLEAYTKILALFAAFGEGFESSDYLDVAILYMIERILDYRWRAFERVNGKDPKYFELLEEMTKAHAELLLAPIKGATHDMMYGKPIPHPLKATE